MDELTPIAEKVSVEVVSNTPWPMLGLVHDLFDENQMLKARVEQLEARLNQNSSNSSKPPSSDNPFKKSPKETPIKKAKSRRKRKGHRQQCLRPTAGSKKKKGTAHAVVDLTGKLYHLESQARKRNFSPEAIMAMRTENVKPILDNIKKLFENAVNAVPPKSLLGKAIAYSVGQWSRIEAYLQDPRLTPDNNIAENAIRPFAVGRKNWLFSGSPRGAQASATLYSLIETAKANDLNPYEYLLHVFDKIPLVKTKADLEELLPWSVSKTTMPAA